MERSYNVDVVDLRFDSASTTIAIVGTIRGKDIPDGYEEIELWINNSQAKWLCHNMKKLRKILKDNGE